MKVIVLVVSFIFFQFLWASTVDTVHTLQTDLDCGELPTSDSKSNTEDKDLKCQIQNKYKKIKLEKKEYRLNPDTFYKLFIEHRDGDEYAYLMYNGRKIDEELTQEMHTELAGHGIGQYEFVEWRMRAIQGGLHFTSLILGKVLRTTPEKKVVYQSFKLGGDESCSLNLLSTDDLDEARRVADRLGCNR